MIYTTEVHCLLTCHIADIHWYQSFSAIVLSQYCEHSTVVWIWDLKYCQSIGNTAGSVGAFTFISDGILVAF